MKKLFTLFAILTLVKLYAQTYNGPESIEYDFANNRWLISNSDAGNILARSNSGILSVFTAIPSAPYGIEIAGNVLYVCDGSRVKGYNLSTAAEVFNVNTGATFLNGITHDNNNNLYVTDFSGKKIYRVNTSTQQVTTFVTGLAKSPNGIIYDQPNNRCVFVNWGANAPVMAVSLADSTVSTLVLTTLSNCDGIAKDGSGNYYISSWGLNGISKFDNTFTSGPTTVASNLSSPADIYYNTVSDTLAVPNSGTANNTVYFYFGPPPPCADPVITPNNLILCPNTSDTLWTQVFDSYQWIKDGIPINNATNQYYVVNAFADGGSSFTVEATLNNCSNTSEPVLVDGWVFLPPFVITEGNTDSLCVGDTLLLIMGQPYDVSLQWTINGSDIIGATNDTLIVTTSGSYSVSGAPSTCPNYIQNLGLQLQYNFVVCETGLGEETSKLTMSVYPNPASDFVNLIVDGEQSYKNYSLIDCTGRVLTSGNIIGINTLIDVSKLPGGIYMIQANGKNNTLVKFIKQ